MKDKKIPQLDIFYHSGNIEKITEIYHRYNPEIYGDLIRGNFKKAVTGFGKNKQENFRKTKKSSILIASGGMMGGGAIETYLDLLDDPKNLFVSVGYQGEGTLGRDIFINNIKETEIDGLGKININSSLHNFRGFSGHADEEDLLDVIKKMTFSKEAKIIVNHGEKTPEQYIFGTTIKNIVGDIEVILGDFNEKYYN